MAMNKMLLRLSLALMVAFLAACAPSPAVAASFAVSTPTTCASEGYTYTKLQWCVAICESSLSQAQKDVYTRRWMDRYRDLPYCLLD